MRSVEDMLLQLILQGDSFTHHRVASRHHAAPHHATPCCTHHHNVASHHASLIMIVPITVLHLPLLHYAKLFIALLVTRFGEFQRTSSKFAEFKAKTNLFVRVRRILWRTRTSSRTRIFWRTNLLRFV